MGQFVSLAVNAIQDEEAIVLVTPSDHLVSPITDYQACLSQAIALASTQDKIFLFGITPTAPAISFGYIELADAKNGYHDIRCFHEKPDASTAETYVAQGSFLWNSGIFCFSKRAFIKEMEAIAQQRSNNQYSLCPKQPLYPAMPSKYPPMSWPPWTKSALMWP